MVTKLADLHPKRGILRMVLRMPIWLYRIHMGWLLGDRFLMRIALENHPRESTASAKSAANFRGPRNVSM